MGSLNNVSMLTLGFVTLILGAVLIGVVATGALNNTQKTVIFDESHDMTTCFASNGTVDQVQEGDALCELTVTNYPSGWKITDCPLTSVTVTNGTAVDLWTLDNDYTLTASNGSILLLNTSATQHLNEEVNTSEISYTYCQDTYMNLSWGRTTLNLVAGFFALALLLVALGLFYKVAKENNIF